MHAMVYDRTEQPVVYRSLGKTSDERLSRIYVILLQIDRLQLTAVYCNRREVKTTPQKTRFRSVNLYKEFAYKSKLSKWLQRQEFDWRHEAQSETQQCVKWPETLGEHVSVSVVDANAWVFMHWRSFFFVVSLFCCQLVLLSFDCLPW